ncbi:lachesin isoform X2 [Folsomia candida]|uniref:lachesin isoform X2 n=1 Tax=Folsomia candida TaxID=158441 RepID=UPI001604C40D|nr:lachesin isoform X2 [Folsomia candida]
MKMEISVLSLLFWIFFHSLIKGSISDVIQMPRFVGPMENVTVVSNREGILSCVVENLGSYKVAFLRVSTQTILTIGSHVISRSHRIGLSHTESRAWNLHIRHAKQSDAGYYMCQVNTDPMLSQLGYLQVVVPPDILDYPTSTDMVVREGTNVSLICAATGFPQPTVSWQREDKQKIPYGEDLVETIEGSVFNISKVNRLHMGAYLCIASNGVAPKVSRRILIIVHFPPMIWVQQQLIGVAEGDDVILECQSEAYPKSINYWVKHNGDIIVSLDGSPIDSYNGEKYEPVLLDNAYKVTMRLTIRGIQPPDYGSYACLSKNSLGSTDGQIKIYQILPLVSSTVAAKPTTLPSSSSSATNPEKASAKKNGTAHSTKTKSQSTKTSRRESDHNNAMKPQSTTAVQIQNPDGDSSSRHLEASLFIVLSFCSISIANQANIQKIFSISNILFTR